ncbi:hypothetical protein PVAND_005006 [Polypedilum vanderplanki]|uniref:Uncharacterized protein n=1 Tax=Polypedilum vanderplanki TaxID=319348 RepID=A0A9J6BYZ5_POLVA|nr:hypothetical protein PVAND_005006 [Polypedilum vanderplanki]
MEEGEYWNNLESFVDKNENIKPPSPPPPILAPNAKDTVGNWLKNIPSRNIANKKNKNELKSKSKNITAVQKAKKEESDKNNTQKAMKKKPDSVSAKRSRKCLLEGSNESVKKLYVPRLFLNKKTKFKSKNKNKEKLFFGPVVECNFNLPRVSQQLERLMGSSVVRLTDRKYMLDLQKRIQEDYHDTLMKRISNRQASELERERRSGNVGNEKYPKMIAEHPVFVINNKSNALLMNKRNKLKTVRAKNAEELIKQGKRWERERVMMTEQERVNEIEARKEREKMLEDHTLYIFDAEKADIGSMDFMKIKSKKFTDCEIDLKNFLLSERENMKIKRMEEQNEFMKAQESKKASQNLTVATPTALRSQDIGSFDEKQESTDEKSENVAGIRILENDSKLQISAEEMRRKQAKKDEDPKIARFKGTENVREMYALAEQIISSDVIKGA